MYIVEVNTARERKRFTYLAKSIFHRIKQLEPLPSLNSCQKTTPCISLYHARVIVQDSLIVFSTMQQVRRRQQTTMVSIRGMRPTSIGQWYVYTAYMFLLFCNFVSLICTLAFSRNVEEGYKNRFIQFSSWRNFI